MLRNGKSVFFFFCFDFERFDFDSIYDNQKIGLNHRVIPVKFLRIIEDFSLILE